MATIRFRELVKTAGRPEPKSLWTDPRQDREFMRAVKQNRVLTIVQEPGAKTKDFGEIGFQEVPHANYFIFPKPLPSQKGKVIGIKYDLMEEAKPGDALSAKELKQAPRAKKSAVNPEPPEKEFRFRVHAQAVFENTIQVRARNRREAETKAEEIAQAQPLDLAKAKIKTTIQLVD